MRTSGQSVRRDRESDDVYPGAGMGVVAEAFAVDRQRVLVFVGSDVWIQLRRRAARNEERPRQDGERTQGLYQLVPGRVVGGKHGISCAPKCRGNCQGGQGEMSS